MRRGPILFLRVSILVVGVVVLAGMLWEPHLEGRNVDADLATIYFRDPFLAYAYMGSLPFFFGLYQAFKLTGYASRDHSHSPGAAITALVRIKYCAVLLVVAILGGEAYIAVAIEDDHAGAFVPGALAIFACLVTVVAATLLERVWRGGAGRE